MTRIIETTDAAGSTATIYGMQKGDVFIGSLSPATTDWIAVTLVAGHTYSFGAVGLGAAGSGVDDPLLKLHAANGTILTTDDDGGPGLCADMSFTATSTGTYYIEVAAPFDTADGAYGLVVNEASRPSYGAELGAGVLYRGGVTWAATPETAVVVTWGVRASGPALDASGDPAPFSVLSAAQTTATLGALLNFAEIGNVSFVQVSPGSTTNSATMLVGAYTSTTDGAGAYAMFPGSTSSGSSDGDMWINNDSVSTTSIPVGSYDYWVFLHELGHAMGLEHPGDYNAAPGVSITYANAAQFIQDSQQYTVMSYFAATATQANSPDSYCDTLMMYDIAAIQEMYGVNHSTRSGNDTYGFNGALGGAFDFTVNTDPLLCIWDGAGIDTLNLSGYGGKQLINLNDGTFSNVGGFTGNLSIAVGANIENAVGGLGSDRIIGNELANTLRGGRGIDILSGGAGADTLTGGFGADGFIFAGGFGRDRINDFNLLDDLISLSSNLWGGAAKTAVEVLNQFGVVRNGHVVLDFGMPELTIWNLTSEAGLADRLLIA